jgi:hypothetical protein
MGLGLGSYRARVRVLYHGHNVIAKAAFEFGNSHSIQSD